MGTCLYFNRLLLSRRALSQSTEWCDGRRRRKKKNQNKYVKHVFPFIDVPFYEYYSNGRDRGPVSLWYTFRSIFNCRCRTAVGCARVEGKKWKKKRFDTLTQTTCTTAGIRGPGDRYGYYIIITIMVSLRAYRSGTHPSPSSHLPAEERPRPKWLQSRLVPCKCHTRVVDRTPKTVRNSRVFLHGYWLAYYCIPAMCRLYAIVAVAVLAVPYCCRAAEGVSDTLMKMFRIETMENRTADVQIPSYMYELYEDTGNRRYDVIRSITPTTGNDNQYALTSYYNIFYLQKLT